VHHLTNNKAHHANAVSSNVRSMTLEILSLKVAPTALRLALRTWFPFQICSFSISPNFTFTFSRKMNIFFLWPLTLTYDLGYEFDTDDDGPTRQSDRWEGRRRQAYSKKNGLTLSAQKMHEWSMHACPLSSRKFLRNASRCHRTCHIDSVTATWTRWHTSCLENVP